jgi:hypothetical protein
MNPLNSCPRCGRPCPAGVKFCPGCGSNLSSTSVGKRWKLLFGAFAILIGVLWAAVVLTRTQPAAQFAGGTQPQALSGQGATPTAVQSSPSPALTLTSAQHLSEAKRALADGYKPNKDPQKAQWGEVSAAKWHLKAIGSSALEYREAQELLKEVARRERQIELAKKQAEKGTEEEAAATESNEASSTASSSPAPAATRQTLPASGGSSDEYYTNSKGNQVHRPVYSESGPPTGATAQCADGTYSFSQSRRGTCSHHGGVSRWL